MEKIIAIDFGLKRTGIAYSDDFIQIAHPLKTVPTQLLWDFLNKFFSHIKKLFLIHSLRIGIKGVLPR